MENIWMRAARASFTVEAAFVMSITIWVLTGICYLSLYSHDQAAMYSLLQNYLETSVENGKDCSESEMQKGMKVYLQKHCVICRVDSVLVKKELLSVRAEVKFHPEITLPVIRRLLSAEKSGIISGSHERIFAPYYVWDSEAVKNTVK